MVKINANIGNSAVSVPCNLRFDQAVVPMQHTPSFVGDKLWTCSNAWYTTIDKFLLSPSLASCWIILNPLSMNHGLSLAVAQLEELNHSVWRGRSVNSARNLSFLQNSEGNVYLDSS